MVAGFLGRSEWMDGEQTANVGWMVHTGPLRILMEGVSLSCMGTKYPPAPQIHRVEIPSKTPYSLPLHLRPGE